MPQELHVYDIEGKLESLLYIVLTIGILIGQEPSAYFENSRDFVDKHDFSIICYPIISEDYTLRSAQCAPLALKWFGVI